MRIALTPAVRRTGLLTALAVCVLSAAMLSAAAGVVSVWKTQAAAADGLPNDGEALATLERGVTVGAVNDDEFLHMVVSTSDPESLGPFSTGLIVWLDFTGRRGQTFGLRIPGVEGPMGTEPGPVAQGAASGAISTRTLDHFDVLGPGKNQRRLVDLTPDLGIALVLGLADGQVTYELTLPLAKTATRPYAVGAGPGKTVGLGIATPEAPRTASQNQPLVGSSGFIGGNPFYGGGFAPYREKDGRPKPLEVWTTLMLASPAR